MQDKGSADVHPKGAAARRRITDTRNALYLVAELREWLDFVMWFRMKYPAGEPVRRDWFVEKFARGTYPGNPGVTESHTPRVLQFIGRYRVTHPFRWLMRVGFRDDYEREIPYERFITWLRGEPRGLLHSIFEKTGKLAPWHKCDDIFPQGATRREAHQNYRKTREQVLDYYAQLAATSPIPPPFSGFPEPVPLAEGREDEEMQTGLGSREGGGPDEAPEGEPAEPVREHVAVGDHLPKEYKSGERDAGEALTADFLARRIPGIKDWSISRSAQERWAREGILKRRKYKVPPSERSIYVYTWASVLTCNTARDALFDRRDTRRRDHPDRKARRTKRQGRVGAGPV